LPQNPAVGVVGGRKTLLKGELPCRGVEETRNFDENGRPLVFKKTKREGVPKEKGVAEKTLETGGREEGGGRRVGVSNQSFKSIAREEGKRAKGYR